MKRLIATLWIALFLGWGDFSLADSPADVIQRAQSQKLHEHPQWESLLFLKTTMFTQRVSLVDSDGFFLSPEGKKSSWAEMEATIRYISQAQSPKESENFRCRFPARYRWLKKSLQVSDEIWPEEDCPDLDSWIEMIDADKLYLVFSSYYLDNPVSMMGHTFMRVSRTKSKDRQSFLLDNAINFAAQPDTSNPFLYSFKGLVGMFPGIFSLERYYYKVQSYSNAESRDLWEYELNLPREQIELMVYSVWEMGPHYIDYFYFDENCSLIMLYLLKVAAPKLDLTSGFNSFVNPSDTVRKLFQFPDFVKDVIFRPSNRSEFYGHFEQLDSNQRIVLQNIITDSSFAQLETLPLRGQAKVLDAFLAFVSYKEKLAGSEEAKTYKALYQGALTLRSKNQERNRLDIKPNLATQPHLGHYAYRMGAGVHNEASGSGQFLFNWRPSIHDQLSSPEGFVSDLSLEMGNIDLIFNSAKNQLSVAKFDFANIFSMRKARFGAWPKTWKAYLGARRSPHCRTDGVDCLASKFEAGLGGNLDFLSDQIYLWAMPKGKVEYQDFGSHETWVGLGTEGGFLIRPKYGPRFLISLQRWLEKGLGGSTVYRSRLDAGFGYSLAKQQELRFTLESDLKTSVSQVTLMKYF